MSLLLTRMSQNENGEESAATSTHVFHSWRTMRAAVPNRRCSLEKEWYQRPETERGIQVSDKTWPTNTTIFDPPSKAPSEEELLMSSTHVETPTLPDTIHFSRDISMIEEWDEESSMDSDSETVLKDYCTLLCFGCWAPEPW